VLVSFISVLLVLVVSLALMPRVGSDRVTSICARWEIRKSALRNRQWPPKNTCVE
jgi:hypothetical protein